ncbi:prolyl aminopeptidase [Leifsonia shinshuensis]|uniref:prolyl aminopeptidase n=1 Tax=Leifsonia shinshuensis TaxID=150026 RepID=UPI0028642F8E|nr:prolyl aminopeptidase [Leifsonia shinshuensis]MDR6972519.1 proline iminopeptidase [Leifsonia shinshuensis]
MFPVIEPFAHGWVENPDGDSIYWETSGNPDGIPVLWLHGGPGSGLATGGYRTRYDPERFLLVGIDQRGCGRSTPSVADAPERLARNTTGGLIADIELVRERVGVDRWIVTGASWGSTLALAYALEHPGRVRSIVLGAVTTTGRDEVTWLTETMGRLFPEAWEAFEAASGRRPGERVVEAYARILASGTPEERMRAADAWDAWESTHVSLDPNVVPGPMREDPVQRLVSGTLVTHYWANDAFLPGDRAILKRVSELAAIPAVLIHGRHDVSGPVVTPWLLHREWPASRLIVIEGEGHWGPQVSETVSRAITEMGDA